MDVVLDLWINAIYNDTQVQGSELGPVVYLRNGTGCPLVSYCELAQRWGVSKATAGRYLKKLENQGYISLSTFPGTHGSAIYLQSYLSTMFQISDVMIDKEEVAMALSVNLHLPVEPCDSVSTEEISVSKLHISAIEEKVCEVLALQGIFCFDCPKSKYMLLPLSDDCEGNSKHRGQKLPTEQSQRFNFSITCGEIGELYRFELTLIRKRNNSERRPER